MSHAEAYRFPLLVVAALTSIVAVPATGQFVNSNNQLPTGPGINSDTERVTFADVDWDGDWDAAFADGGDTGNDQNRLWINQGGAQLGAIGSFSDETSGQMPVLSDDSRDLDFADIDGDGDLDIHTSNTATITNQGNRWLINQGGLQGGSIGFFADDTANRWLGLASANSSVPASYLLADTFIDWCRDSEFADVDNDGDLDVFHSSNALNAQVPSRLFLNDGGGYFEEFNPSGFTLESGFLADGDPGLWCSGVQQTNTADATGAFCDVAGMAADVGWGDVDGDLDLDLTHDDLQLPRFFLNRLEEAGSLQFIDSTNATYPPNYVLNASSYEQGLGDMDDDGDLDLFGLNWNGFVDVTLINDGSGGFGAPVNVPGPQSSADAEEAEFIDYDNDGDLDLYIALFGGNHGVLRNTLAETGVFSYATTTGVVPAFTSIAKGADVCDVDGDGDYDVFVAEANSQQNTYLENVNNTPDTTAPKLYRLEARGPGAASATPSVVRVQVYDNAPEYLTRFNPTHLEVRVDGIQVPDVPMQCSGGQIFRGEIPGNLVGLVEYRAVSSDPYGNTGTTPPKAFTQTGPTGTLGGASSDTSLGGPLTLRSLTAPIAGEPLYLAGQNAAAGALTLFGFSLSSLPGVDIGDGLVVNLGLPLIGELIPSTADAAGTALFAASNVPLALFGLTLHTQAIALSGAAGNTFASSQSLALNF